MRLTAGGQKLLYIPGRRCPDPGVKRLILRVLLEALSVGIQLGQNTGVNRPLPVLRDGYLCRENQAGEAHQQHEKKHQPVATLILLF